jgi:DNA-binding transcriptional LysR family regulator
LSGERLIRAFNETHPLLRDKIASGEGIRGQFVDSRVAERLLLGGIDIGLCILPIHDGFITTRGDEFVLESLMNDSFREITGCSAKLKPESFDLSVLPEDVGDGPRPLDFGAKTRWITRPDGTVERDAIREGKAIAYSGHFGGVIVEKAGGGGWQQEE